MNNIIVLFEVKPTKEGMAKYLELAAMLKELLANADGFVRAERFTSLNNEGKLLSLNVWESEEALATWRNNLEHRMSQAEGKNKLFESYNITVCQSIREYSHEDRENAPNDSNRYLREEHIDDFAK